MGLAATVPAMRPGNPVRNAVVGLGFLAAVAGMLSIAVRTYRPIRGC